MNTRSKKKRSGSAASRKLPMTRLASASRGRALATPNTTRGGIADSPQGADMGDVLLYQAQGGVALEVRVQGDSVWLTQLQMAKLFGRESSVVTKHLNNVFS